MKFSAALICLGLLAACAGCLMGCLPSAQGQLDEEKEPHFLAGKSRVNAMDFKGAVESFEKAIEVNPRSALAHFELGVLFEQRETDPAAAIYHYDRYLRLLPGAGNADTVKTRILACKQELARTVSLGPVTQSLQTEFEKVTEQNKLLCETNKQLIATNRFLQENLDKWRAYYAVRPPAQTNSAQIDAIARPAAATNTPVAGQGKVPAFPTYPAPPTNSPPTRAATASRTHVVKAGETLGLIARRYGISLESLRSANPGIDARRLRPGRVLNVPTAGK